MIKFVDASAMVAYLTREAEHFQRIFEELAATENMSTSSLARWEAAMAILRKSFSANVELSHSQAFKAVDIFIGDWSITAEPIEAEDFRTALVAHAHYGKGSLGKDDYLRRKGWPEKDIPSASKARLNMADCFHYAVAKRLGAGIIFTSSEEFAFTDLVNSDYKFDDL